MRRRDVLRSSAGALALASLGGVASAAQEDATYEPMGEVAIEGTMEVQTTTDGSHAIVAAADGFAIVDVTDPASPQIAAERGNLLEDHEDGPMKNIADVKVDADRLLVTGPNQPPREGALPNAALLYDISDPANPEQLDVFEVDHAIHNSFYADGYAYLTISDFSYEGVKIVDTSGDSMSEVATYSIVDHDEKWQDVNGFLRSCHDLYVQGDYMYLAQWDAGTFIVDVSDKSSPEFVGRAGGLPADKLAAVVDDHLATVAYQPPGNAHYVQPDGDANYLYVGGESWDVNSDDDKRGASGIEIYDISDKSSPEKVNTIHPPGAEDESFRGNYTTSHNFDIDGDRLYTSWYYGGVMIHDLSDRENPERLSWWRQPSEADFWGTEAVSGSDFFVAGNMSGSLMTFSDEAGEMADPPGEFTPPEETEIVTEVDWEKVTDGAAEETTTTTDEETTTTDEETTTTDEETTTVVDETTTTAEPTTTELDMEDGADGEDGEDGEDGADGEDGDGSEGESPGFGALAAAGGIGLGAARLLQKRDDETDAE